MAFITNEYSKLIGQGCDDVILIPNQLFEAFEGDYIVSAYARVLEVGGKEAIILQAGDKIKGIANTVKQPTFKIKRTRKKKEVKDGNGL